MAQVRRPERPRRGTEPPRRRPPSRRDGRGPDRRPRELEEEQPPEAPFWERIVLSGTFRVVVGATLASAALAVLIFLIGPTALGLAASAATSFATRQSLRLGGGGSLWVADMVREEGRRLWVETATPLPTAPPTATSLPTASPFPTAPPRRSIATPTPPFPAKPGQSPPPLRNPGAPAALPIDAVIASTQEYFEILSSGDARRALQYWAPESQPEARSALDAAVARGETYRIKNITPRALPQINGADVTVDLEILDANGNTIPAQHRYQWRVIDNQWYITTRLQ
ncbi:MAG TPA: hypothetical protein VGM69_00075 [Chloroflexota bacterium]|jgi:hypothetical protein